VGTVVVFVAYCVTRRRGRSSAVRLDRTASLEVGRDLLRRFGLGRFTRLAGAVAVTREGPTGSVTLASREGRRRLSSSDGGDASGGAVRTSGGEAS